MFISGRGPWSRKSYLGAGMWVRGIFQAAAAAAGRESSPDVLQGTCVAAWLETAHKAVGKKMIAEIWSEKWHSALWHNWTKHLKTYLSPNTQCFN